MFGWDKGSSRKDTTAPPPIICHTCCILISLHTEVLVLKKSNLTQTFINFFRERGKEGKRKRNTDVRGKHQLVVSCPAPVGDQTRNPGMHPDWELNQRPVTLRGDAQTTGLHQPGQQFLLPHPPSPLPPPTHLSQGQADFLYKLANQ